MNKSRRVRWAEYEARMEEKSNAYRVLLGNTRRKETARKT
jgi:hypothetical protein